MKRKILFSIIILTVAFSTGIALKTKAGVGDSGSGWLWGGSEEAPDGAITGNETGVGWISMNSTNCDADSNGFIDVNYCDLDSNGFVDVSCGGDNATDVSASCGGDNVTTAIIDYGVNILPGPGISNVSGEAWSENLGYINFDPAGPYPVVATGDDYSFSVRRNGNELRGWARITGIQTELAAGNSGNWEGWIRMHSDPTGDLISFGVDITKMDGTGANPTRAWSDELGWIDFSRASVVVPKTLKICENACDSGIMRAIEGIPDSLSVTEGALDKNLRACYNNDPGCGDSSGDVTLDVNTTWTEAAIAPPTDGAFQLSVVAPNEVMSFNAVTADTTENLSVTYNDAGTPHTADFDVTVIDAACVPDCTCAAVTCIGDTCDDGCGGTCAGTMDCPIGSNWKEVAP